MKFGSYFLIVQMIILSSAVLFIRFASLWCLPQQIIKFCHFNSFLRFPGFFFFICSYINANLSHRLQQPISGVQHRHRASLVMIWGEIFNDIFPHSPVCPVTTISVSSKYPWSIFKTCLYLFPEVIVL